MLRPETKGRARAVQLLYVWEIQHRPPIDILIHTVLSGHPHWRAPVERAEGLVRAVTAQIEQLDGRIADAVEHWRPGRLGIIERCILRLALHELDAGDVPPKVVITEAVRLAHWFAGASAPGFVNGVLDALARQEGRL
jgi:N utilization substance protein B